MVRPALLTLLACYLLPAADWKIDHATVAGSDLNQLRTRLQKVGIETVYGGAHTNHATEMALVSFPDGSYLELMGIQPQADAAAVQTFEWSKFLTTNAGPCAFALRERDLPAEVARLRAAGITVSEPAEGGRKRPDGVALAWQSSSIGDAIRGTFFPFLIQDKTPREQRVYPQGKPVTRDFRGVARVVIAVRNLESAIQRYRQAYGVPPPIKQVDADFGAQLALLGGGTVILAAPLNGQSWLAKRLDEVGEAPCAFILAANKLSKWKGASNARWFGAEIKWLDAGWRLGVEASR